VPFGTNTAMWYHRSTPDREAIRRLVPSGRRCRAAAAAMKGKLRLEDQAKRMERVVILGGGIAGLSTAWLLQQCGLDYLVIERQPVVGGLARSFEWHGFNCDFAAHRLFTRNEDVLAQLLRLVPMGRHLRRSRIYMRGQWLRDPLDVAELGTRLPPQQTLRMALSYLARPRHLPDTHFENYVLRRYGRALYQRFFQPYTEKLFGLRGDEIAVGWARQKVRLANPLDLLRENTKSKFGYFYYPRRGGYGSIAERLYREVHSAVLTRATVVSLTTDGGGVSAVTYVQNGGEVTIPARAVVSTLPITLLGRMFDLEIPLEFRKVDAVYVLVNRPAVSDYHWHYFIDADICINRLIEFKNLSSEGVPEATSVLCAEVTQDISQPARQVVDDLIRVGLVEQDEVLDTLVIRENHAYPVYQTGYEDHLQAAHERLSAYRNLYLVGRGAQFAHLEVDDDYGVAAEVVKMLQSQIVAPRLPAAAPELAPGPRGPVSVAAVILTHNNYVDTHECLESVHAMGFEGLRVILVDNGSTDGTPGKVRQDFPGVDVVEVGQNLGVPSGYNLGFRAALDAGATYVLMLNNDTTVSPSLLTELLAAGEADSRAGMLMPKILHYGSTDRIWSIGGQYRAFPPSIVLSERGRGRADVPRFIEYAPGCGLLIHRRAFEEAGLFDPGYLFWYDDWDFSERVRACGLHIHYVPGAVMWHKVARTTKGPDSPLFWRTYGASAVRFYRRHGRPQWLSLPLHIGYMMLRDFVWKGNWRYLPRFLDGMRQGLAVPLGPYPLLPSQSAAQTDRHLP